MGRVKEFTGIWNCCGSTDHFSIYCPSLEARQAFEKNILVEKQRKIDGKLIIYIYILH